MQLWLAFLIVNVDFIAQRSQRCSYRSGKRSRCWSGFHKRRKSESGRRQDPPHDRICITRVVRPSGQRIMPWDVRWSTRTKCAPAPNRWSQSAMGRAAGFAWCRPTPSWWTPFAQCHTVAQATKFSRGAAASDCPPGPRPGGRQRGSRKRDCRRPLREPASKGQPATGCSPV